MPNRHLVDIYKIPAFKYSLNTLEDLGEEKYPGIKTFFRGFKNPIGIEIEAEKVRPQFVSRLCGYKGFWYHKEDGSLKDEGREFITYPISGASIDYAIHEFSLAAKEYPVAYSHRCSIHVHANVSQYRENNLKALAALYGLFEELFYQLMPTERRASPFCYPITQLSPSAVTVVHPDIKYFSFNVAPIKTQMTVEFRILHGTHDWTLIRRWVQVVCKLVRYAQEMEPEKVKDKINFLPKTQAFDRLLKEIFGATSVMFSGTVINQACLRNLFWSQMVINGIQ